MTEPIIFLINERERDIDPIIDPAVFFLFTL